MKILLLEDNDERIQQFKDWIPSLDIAITAEEAINLLKANKYDLIFLDHDLGGKVFVDSSEFNTGYTVARYMRENLILSGMVIVHSHNVVGAANIKAVLPHAVLLPFGTFTCEVKVENNVVTKLNVKPIGN